MSRQVAAQADQLTRLEESLRNLRDQHKKLDQAIQEELESVAKSVPAAAQAAAGDASLEKLLGSVRNLITATLPEQVFGVLTEEAGQLAVRAAVFDVRGKAAWGAAMRGFDLPEKAFRSLAVPLNQDNPFRQAYETGGHVDLTGDQLKKIRNVFDKFKPASKDVILLLPIRSAGSVSAVCYLDTGGRSEKLPVDALKILAEFAGAQLDRLLALSGGAPAGAPAPEAPTEAEAPVVEAEVEAEEAEPATPEPAEVEPPPPPSPPPKPAAAEGFDISSLSEEDQRSHKDAKRFARLLVSEIELYNKTKVADGRKNKDIYKRLKSDIERSRQTYGKRFAKSVGKQYDYFHEELIRTLANNDVSLLGSEYPGPSV